MKAIIFVFLISCICVGCGGGGKKSSGKKSSDRQEMLLKNAGFPADAEFSVDDRYDVQGVSIGHNLKHVSSVIPNLKKIHDDVSKKYPGTAHYKGSLNGFELRVTFSERAEPGKCMQVAATKQFYKTPPDWEAMKENLVERYGKPGNGSESRSFAAGGLAWGNLIEPKGIMKNEGGRDTYFAKTGVSLSATFNQIWGGIMNPHKKEWRVEVYLRDNTTFFSELQRTAGQARDASLKKAEEKRREAKEIKF